MAHSNKYYIVVLGECMCMEAGEGGGCGGGGGGGGCGEMKGCV